MTSLFPRAAHYAWLFSIRPSAWRPLASWPLYFLGPSTSRGCFQYVCLASSCFLWRSISVASSCCLEAHLCGASCCRTPPTSPRSLGRAITRFNFTGSTFTSHLVAQDLGELRLGPLYLRSFPFLLLLHWTLVSVCFIKHLFLVLLHWTSVSVCFFLLS